LVIHFGRRSLEEVNKHWPQLLARVERLVKPEREKRRENKQGRDYKKRWWQFATDNQDLAAAVAGKSRVLVAAVVTKHLVFSFQPTGPVYSSGTYIFPLERASPFAVLQSRLHRFWVRRYSSTFGDGIRYSATDCLANFPFPQISPHAALSLESFAEAFHARRQEILSAENIGFTSFYNALNDIQDSREWVLEMRAAHERLDALVLAEYGWSDMAVPAYAETSPAFEAAVMPRLLDLNTERAVTSAPCAKQQKSK
jgi:hypothetical protein